MVADITAHPKRGVGRPSDYTPELGEIVCETISAGGTLEEAAKAAGIGTSTIQKWAARHTQFRTDLAQARVEWAEAKVDKCTKLAEEEPRMIRSEDGSARVDPGWVQHITSQLNWIKWVASKRDSARYGDKSEVKVSGTIEHRHTLTEDRRKLLMERRRLALDVTPGHGAEVVQNLLPSGEEGAE